MFSIRTFIVAVALLCAGVAFAQTANTGESPYSPYQKSNSTITVYWSSFNIPVDHIAITIYTNSEDITNSTIFTSNDAKGGIPYSASGTYTNSALALTSGTTYYVIVYSHTADHTIAQQATTSGVTVDTDPPVGIVSVAGDAKTQKSTTTIEASWAFTDTLSGMRVAVDAYSVGVGTAPGKTNVAPFTKYPNTVAGASFTGLVLKSGTTYYATMIASDAVGNTAKVSSKGVTVE